MSLNSYATSSQPKSLKDSSNGGDPNFIAPNLRKTNSFASKLLSPEFNNTKDEAELGKMMGDNGEKLLALVDEIRKIDSLRNEELHIPQVLLGPLNIEPLLTSIARLWLLAIQVPESPPSSKPSLDCRSQSPVVSAPALLQRPLYAGVAPTKTLAIGSR
jgi:hypothetical protein